MSICSPLSRRVNRVLSRRAVALAPIAALFAALPLRAQAPIAKADALLRAGEMLAAESLYYAAVRHAPRNPRARLALGRYLAARGALRVGAVLMEEARLFGADSGEVASQLAPVYGRLGDYRALASLPPSLLPFAERARAAWLRDNPPSVAGPDSTSIPYQPDDGTTLGRIVMRIGPDSIIVTINPRASGLTLDTAWAHRKRVERFAAARDRDPRRAAGVVRSLGFGELTLTNVPVRFAPQRSARVATIGPDVLGAFAPTIDPVARTILLRKSGRLTGSSRGRHIPTLVIDGSLWLMGAGKVVPLSDPGMLRLLRAGPWTLNPRRGEMLVSGP